MAFVRRNHFNTINFKLLEDLSFDLEINLLAKKVSLTNRMNLSIEGELIIFELLCFPTKSWMDGLRERGDDSMVIFFF